MLPNEILSTRRLTYDRRRPHALIRSSMSLSLITLFVAFVLYRLIYYVFRLKHYGFVKGYRPLLGPHSFPGAAIPTSKWHRGFLFAWIQRGTAHSNYAYDFTTSIPFFGQPEYFAVSLDVAKQILGIESRNNISRPFGLTTARIWGHSVASANGADWKRHRRLVAPGFNPQMYTDVINESSSLYHTMNSDEGWSSKDEVVISDMTPLILRYTLVIICRCAYGLPIEWKPNSTPATNITAFEQSLSIAVGTMHVRLMTPNWMWSLPFKAIRRVNNAWNSIMIEIKDIAYQRQQGVANAASSGNGHDILTKLVEATDDAHKYSMTPDEVTANMLTLLFAGNETTASALYAVIVLLACHQDVQEIAYHEMQANKPANDAALTINDIQQMKYLLACLYEAIRLVPPVGHLFRDINESVCVHSSRPVEKDIYIRENSRLMVDLFSVAHNPHDYKHPESFLPSRWNGVSDQDYPMFGIGPRACLGRKFAQTEILTVLFHLLSDWRIDVDLEVGQTREMVEVKALDEAVFLRTAFSLPPVPLRLIRRLSTT